MSRVVADGYGGDWSVKTRQGCDTRRKIVAAIKHLTIVKGFPPTYREIMEEVGLGSPSVVSYHIHILAKEKRVRRTAGVARSVIVIGDDNE